MPSSPPALPGSLLPQSHSQYAHHLFTNPLFSDCTITSGKRKFHLHRCILAPRCEFFHSCFTGSFEEASSTSITMHDDDPDVLERMLQWLYTLDFPRIKDATDTQSTRKSSSSGFSWTADLDLWIMADKYGLTVLMEQCANALIESADRAAAAAASETGSETTQAFKASVEDFVDMMGTLFSECPVREDVLDLQSEILAIMAPVIARFMRELPVLEELVTDIPGFAVALVETLSKGESKGVQMHKSSRARRRSLSSEVSANSSRASLGSGRSGSASSESGRVKVYIPMNEDSEDELE